MFRPSELGNGAVQPTNELPRTQKHLGCAYPHQPQTHQPASESHTATSHQAWLTATALAWRTLPRWPPWRASTRPRCRGTTRWWRPAPRRSRCGPAPSPARGGASRSRWRSGGRGRGGQRAQSKANTAWFKHLRMPSITLTLSCSPSSWETYGRVCHGDVHFGTHPSRPLAIPPAGQPYSNTRAVGVICTRSGSTASAGTVTV